MKKNFISLVPLCKIVSKFLLLLLTVVLFFVPKDLRADAPGTRWVYTYEDLVKASQNPSIDTIYITQSENFGWPATPTELTVKARMQLDSPFYIPKNMTLRVSSGFGYHMPKLVTLASKMIFETRDTYYGGSNAGNMIIESGGELTIDKSSHNVDIDHLTVKKGAALNVNSFLYVFEGDVLTLEKGAEINSPGTWSIRVMGNGIIKSNGATINGDISASDSDGQKPTNFLEGTLTVDGFSSFTNVSLPSKATLNVTRNIDLLSSYADQPAPTFTIENGAVLNLKNYVKVNSGCIKVKKGGIVNAENLVLQNTMMNDQIQGDSSMILDSGAVLNIERFLRLKSKASIKGHGTIIAIQNNTAHT